MDQHIKEMQVTIELGESKQQKLETELKASIDKVFDLRDIIAELEKQVHDKSTNEHVLAEKLKVRRLKDNQISVIIKNRLLPLSLLKCMSRMKTIKVNLCMKNSKV